MQRLSEVQIDRLIDLVKKNPILYEAATPGIRPAREKLWRQISRQLHASEVDTKTAWRSLRDQFQKTTRDPSGKKRHKYYNRLMFLQGVIKPSSRSLASMKDTSLNNGTMPVAPDSPFVEIPAINKEKTAEAVVKVEKEDNQSYLISIFPDDEPTNSTEYPEEADMTDANGTVDSMNSSHPIFNHFDTSTAEDTNPQVVDNPVQSARHVRQLARQYAAANSINPNSLDYSTLENTIAEDPPQPVTSTQNNSTPNTSQQVSQDFPLRRRQSVQLSATLNSVVQQHSTTVNSVSVSRDFTEVNNTSLISSPKDTRGVFKFFESIATTINYCNFSTPELLELQNKIYNYSVQEIKKVFDKRMG